MDIGLLLIQLLNGLQLGILLFLIASGLTLVFGIMDFVNLAHGSFYMLGAFFCASLTIWLGGYFDNAYLFALVLSLPLVGLVGYLTERLIIRHLYARNHLDHVLVTFGLILCFETLVHFFFGPEGFSVPLPQWLNGQVTLYGDTVFPSFRLLIILFGLSVAAMLYWIVNFTKLGMLVRAGASNRVMVGALGVNISALYSFVFAFGAVLAGLSGMLIAPIDTATLDMGNSIIIVAFVVIIIGGIGSIKGAFIASLVVGLVDTLGRSYLDDIFKLFMDANMAETSAPAISSMLIYIIMALILAFRPQGLFPPKMR